MLPISANQDQFLCLHFSIVRGQKHTVVVSPVKHIGTRTCQSLYMKARFIQRPPIGGAFVLSIAIGPIIA
jgi:hypothetical protein